jgi:acetyl esterase
MLDPDARAAAAALAEALPGRLQSLGVAEVRELLNSPPGTVVGDDTVEDLQIDVGDHAIPVRFYRSPGSEPGPALLYIHGGGWTLGTLDGVDLLCRELREQAGCHVVSVAYRLAPEHPFPAGLEDCLSTLNWLQDSAAALHVDPDRIAIGGDSAGGNLSIATCLAAGETGRPMPAYQLLVYPATDFDSDRCSWSEHAHAPLLTAVDARWFMSLYAPSATERVNPLVSPMRAASLSALPPTHVITAEVDVLRDDAEAFAARLRVEGVPVTLTRYLGVFHGFFTEVGVFERTAHAIAEASQLLRTAFAVDTNKERHV